MNKDNQPQYQQSIFETDRPDSSGSEHVTCLGMVFENDEKRREYYLEKLREKLKDPVFRKIEGFPIGEAEDILALSDPPYYTACPNPFIDDFVKQYGKPYDPATDVYSREPFAADVSEGKNDSLYALHSYHTKVPYKAIMKYILHYTEPGDVIFDGFGGTGMTGIAAQCCADTNLVEKSGQNKPGARIPIIAELSTIASFIAGTLNSAIMDEGKIRAFEKIITNLEEQLGWVYETKRPDNGNPEVINYIVWSEVFLCGNCGAELNYYKDSIGKTGASLGSDLQCPKCKVKSPKRSLERSFISVYDHAANRVIKQVKFIPTLIDYGKGKKRGKKVPDDFDLNLIEKTNSYKMDNWFPLDEIPQIERYYKDGLHIINITQTHQFYTKRNLMCAAQLWSSIINNTHRLVFTSFCDRHIVKRNRWLSTGPTRPLNNTLYFPPLFAEVNVFEIAKRKIKDLRRALSQVQNRTRVSISTTQSSTNINQISDCTVDYIFTDPPFGWNITYSELNFIWESWLKVKTNNAEEAIVNYQAKKTIDHYRELIARCFAENYRVLKPGRWMTVVFHNSSNMVWHSIQEALLRAGFVVADIRTLDKKQGSMNQDFYRSGTVKQDLVISAYKPNIGLEDCFKLDAGTEDGVWDFIRTHLKQLPVFVTKDDHVEVIAERQNYLLFDRMIAFHVQRAVTVPLSASEFYAGLEKRFPSRDGMYFLPDQAAEYDKKRMTVKEVIQLQIFVSDEASAIQWLKQQLTKKPQTFQDIHPQFLKEIGGWQKHEKALELSELLKENFLIYDGKGDVPSQIHSYLSTNFKELRNLEKDSTALKAKAKGRWYVPDPNKAGDLEKLRERALMREFQEYYESKQKRLKVFRLEAVRAGFKKAWQERDYATIIAVAGKIPENILQEDPKLLMWYDQALTRSGEVV
jgi:DNA modification methylase